MAYANSSVSVNWYPGQKQKLLELPDKIMFNVARQTLDISYTSIPLSTKKNAGKLRQSSTSSGVRGSDGDYYIGSYTNYAKYVWNMGANTKWSTPGTNGKWYEEIWQKKGKQIIKSAIERNKIQ